MTVVNGKHLVASSKVSVVNGNKVRFVTLVWTSGFSAPPTGTPQRVSYQRFVPYGNVKPTDRRWNLRGAPNDSTAEVNS